MLTMQLQLASRWRFCSSLSREFFSVSAQTKLTSEIKRGAREGSQSALEKKIQTWKTKWGSLFLKRSPKTVYFSLFGSHENPCVLTRSNSPRLIATYKRKQKVSLWTEYCSLFHLYWRKAGLYISDTACSLWFISYIFVYALIQVFCEGNTWRILPFTSHPKHSLHIHFQFSCDFTRKITWSATSRLAISSEVAFTWYLLKETTSIPQSLSSQYVKMDMVPVRRHSLQKQDLDDATTGRKM